MPVRRPRKKVNSQRLLTSKGYIAEVFDRELMTSSAVMVSGVINAMPIYLFAGDVITTITWMSHGAGASLTRVEFGIYDNDGNRLATTGDIKASVAAGEKDSNLSSPLTITKDGLYWIASLCVHGGTAISQGRIGGAMAQDCYGAFPNSPAGYLAAQTDLPATATFVSTFASSNVSLWWQAVK